jgi:hypothetical protein
MLKLGQRYVNDTVKILFYVRKENSNNNILEVF